MFSPPRRDIITRLIDESPLSNLNEPYNVPLLEFHIPTQIIIIYLDHCVRGIDPGQLITTTSRYTAIQEFASFHKINQLTIYLGYFFKTNVIYLDPVGAFAYSLGNEMMDVGRNALMEFEKHWMLVSVDDGGGDGGGGGGGQ